MRPDLTLLGVLGGLGGSIIVLVFLRVLRVLRVSAFLGALAVQLFFTLIAVKIPCMIASGVGGQPGTATSTGITFDTRPQLA